MTEKLNSGAQFPRMALKLSDGGTRLLPEVISGDYHIVLFYRGHW